MQIAHRSPWLWVPTLYFAEGVPYFLVNNISVMLFAKMGVPNDQLAFFTTLLYFPWFLKGLWAPLVDVVKTKRWWILSMQALLTVACVLLTLTLPRPDAVLMATKQTPVGVFWLTLVLFILAAFASATHDIAADGYYMLAHDSSSQARFIGIRSTFYRVASVFGQGVLVFIAGRVETATGSIPFSWQVTIGVTAVVLFLVTLYHTFALPRPEESSHSSQSSQSSKTSFLHAFTTFFTKPGALLAIAFMLLYRLPEGFLIKMCQPFLVDGRELLLRDGCWIGGGLGLPTDMVGLLYGTIGVSALLLGGIVGGLFISKYGLKRSLWWMAAAMTLPCFTFVYLSTTLPTSNFVIGLSISVEQFGYGFGFTAYMMYMMYFAEGQYKTSHYAICTAFMALSMMLPGFVAGAIEMAIGYRAFFWMVMVCCLATIGISALIYGRIPDDYGRKTT